MTTQLSKPHFIKVKDLQHSRSGYNVYVKVVSVQKSETQSNVPIVRAVVADQTGSANAFFKGENASLITEGKVIAIRNGTINFIKNRISLEVDIFGRITPETVEIKTTSTSNNISEKEIERKPRRPRREGEERRPRREGEERRPRREGQERRPRRQQGEERRPRREQGEERRPRRQGEERRPRREGDFDRRPRREGEERRPREEGDRRPRRDENRGDRRPPVKFSKIGAIEPGDEGLNFFAQVVKVENVGKRARVVLGDETGLVRAFLFDNGNLIVGESIVLFGAEAKVIKEHIEVQVPREGKVDKARKRVEEVNESFDVSAKEWVEANE